jgi:ubiquitin conjugation factor E4 B
MSGFLPDLASWALRGGANTGNEEGGEEAAQADAEAVDTGPALTPEEMRAQRLARMDSLQQQAQEQAAQAEAEAQSTDPMDVDPPVVPAAKPDPPKPTPPPVAAQPDPLPKKKKAKAEPSPSDSARKLQRKKELLLKKILNISLAGTLTTSDSSCVVVDIDDTQISAQTVAEILATRLSLSATDTALRTTPPPKPLIPYLAQCHRRAGEELKTVKQSTGNNSKNNAKDGEIAEILREIQRQVVSYAASCLMEPELFELGSDAVAQLTKCLTTTMTDSSTSVIFGVAGSATSWYYLLVEELMQQEASILDKIVAEVVAQLTKMLSTCESVLDAIEGVDGSANVLVSAVTALCLHKRTAEAVTRLPNFLMPPAGSREAAQNVRPAMPLGGNILSMLAGQNPPYLKRSGPAIEKDTLLGLALRVGVPKNNAAFSPTSILRQSLDSVERATSQQRSQLRVHQEACNQLIVALVKAGPEARSKVMKWFVDALLVNVGASAMRPDPSKVSSSNMLLNMSTVLLKLCEPFVDDDKKQHLIDPGFASSPENHGGVFETTGDNAVARLGESEEDTSMLDPYNPKNSFIPQCFFFCARALHFGIVPLLSYHENLLRHISHTHWDITQNGRDLQSDPHFSILVSKQRSNEVALYQEEMVTDTLRFCNLSAKVLFEMDDNVLRTMPEDFVSDVCDIIMAIAKLKPKMLRGIQLRYVFKLVVKLLSAKYASVSVVYCRVGRCVRCVGWFCI